MTLCSKLIPKENNIMRIDHQKEPEKSRLDNIYYFLNNKVFGNMI